ncbi:MAG: hypothetical protein HGA98_00660 [Deltaproteobacteria bacterium]|nr:hypothetical protein [Deltaproteobacteria bacterium]
MTDFKVEKREVPATLRLSDGSELEGVAFLSGTSATRVGPQTADELLEEPGRALPFRRADGSFVLVGKGSVAAFAVPAALGRPPGFWFEVRARVVLAGRHAVEGVLLLEAGAGNRLSDALNSPWPWIPLDTGDHLVWLSKEHIVTLEATSES